MISMRIANNFVQKNSFSYHLGFRGDRKENEERWPTDSVPILWLGKGCSHFGLQLNMPEDFTRDTLSLLDRGNGYNFSCAFVLSLLRGMASLHIMPFESPF